ncbi:hypothetical protein NL676_021378 [Syzygium grande]|nr:hypothetical protein NL676_021378 [Syzygium grande]
MGTSKHTKLSQDSTTQGLQEGLITRYHHTATLAIATIKHLVVYELEGVEVAADDDSLARDQIPCLQPLQSRNSNSKAEKLTQGISEEVDQVGNGRQLAFFEWSNAVARARRRGSLPVSAVVVARWSPAPRQAEGGGSGRGSKKCEQDVNPRNAVMRLELVGDWLLLSTDPHNARTPVKRSLASTLLITVPHSPSKLTFV